MVFLVVVDILKYAAFVAALIADSRRLSLMDVAPTRDLHKFCSPYPGDREAEA